MIEVGGRHGSRALYSACCVFSERETSSCWIVTFSGGSSYRVPLCMVFS